MQTYVFGPPPQHWMLCVLTSTWAENLENSLDASSHSLSHVRIMDIIPIMLWYHAMRGADKWFEDSPNCSFDHFFRPSLPRPFPLISLWCKSNICKYYNTHRLHIHSFPVGGSGGKEPACNAQITHKASSWPPLSSEHIYLQDKNTGIHLFII